MLLLDKTRAPLRSFPYVVSFLLTCLNLSCVSLESRMECLYFLLKRCFMMAGRPKNSPSYTFCTTPYILTAEVMATVCVMTMGSIAHSERWAEGLTASAP